MRSLFIRFSLIAALLSSVSFGYGAEFKNEFSVGMGNAYRSSEHDDRPIYNISYFRRIKNLCWLGLDFSRNNQYVRVEHGARIAFQPTTLSLLYKRHYQIGTVEPYLLSGIGVVKSDIYIEKYARPLYDVTLIAPTIIVGIGVLKDFKHFFVELESRTEYLGSTHIQPTPTGTKAKAGPLLVGNFFLTSNLIRIGIRF